jgi:hypothetical protein
LCIVDLVNLARFKVRLHLLEALQACVGDLAHLVRLEVRPLMPVEQLVELLHPQNAFHVNECIAHIAQVLKVDRQIQEIKRR